MQGYLKAVLAACNKTEPNGQVLGSGRIDGQVLSSRPSATARVGVRCLAMLLKSLAHFNHASDILQVISLTQHEYFLRRLRARSAATAFCSPDHSDQRASDLQG